MVDTRWIAWRDTWWGGWHVGWRRRGIEGSGGGRAAHDGAVARDGAEGKRRGGAACKGAVGKGSGGRTRRGQSSDPSMWVGMRGSGPGARG